MANGEDWLMRPVLHGMCKFESLVDGTLTLEHVAAMNDALSVQQENQRRVERAVRRE